MNQNVFPDSQTLSNSEQKLILGGLLPVGSGSGCEGSGPASAKAYCDSEGKTSVCCNGTSGSAIDFDKVTCSQANGTTVTVSCVIA